VIEREPAALVTAAPYLIRHRDAFLTQIKQRGAIFANQFEAIDALNFRPRYEDAVEQVRQFFSQLGQGDGRTAIGDNAP